ncbi:MAG TPA: GNAT family N-acetyltransferase, partial [Nannocystaceae bacterium]|nr:GNAT family N-acetyltransferase [Nannocystaceae bacterium]
FNAALARETEGKALDRDRLTAGVAALLADEAKGRYFVATRDGVVVGALCITYEWSDWRNGVFWWIQSVYVPASARRQGVYSALYRHVDALARASAGVCGLRLYVDHDNERAQAVYAALGMRASHYRCFEVDFVLA